MSAAQATTLSLYLVSVAIGLDSLEALAARDNYRVGIYSSDILAAVTGLPAARLVQRYPVALAIPLLLIALMLGAVLLPDARPEMIGAALIAHVSRLRYFPLGLAGFDQMATIILGGLLLADAFPGTLVANAGLGFISAEACLAYFTSGAAKASSADWRAGRAVVGILNTRAYGARLPGRLLRAKPRLGLLLDWATILFETGFPLAVLLGGPILIVWLCVGVLFHLGVSATMGLHLFVWTFGASYPILLYVSGHLIGAGA